MTSENRKNKGPDPQEQQWHSLLDTLPGIAYQCLNDRNWTMLFISKGCQELTGYRAGQLLGNKEITYSGLIHPEDRKRIRHLIGRSENRQFELTYRIRTRKGEERWVLERGIRTGRQKDGKEILQGVIVDITAQKTAEEDLALEKERYKAVHDLSPNGILTIDEKGKIRSVNQTFCERTGFEASELVNQPLDQQQWVPEELLGEYKEMLKQIFNGELSKPAEFRWQHRDGSIRWAEVRHSLSGRSRESRWIQAVFSDITERKVLDARKEMETGFEKMLSEILTSFINLRPGNTEHAVHQALERVGSFFGLLRLSIGYQKRGSREVIVRDAWNKKKGHPLRSGYYAPDYPWLLAPFSTGKPLSWTRGIHSGAGTTKGEEQFLADPEIHSLKILPSLVTKDIIYCISYFTSREYTGRVRDFEDRLLMLGHTIGHALLRETTETELRTREKKYRYLFQHMAQGAFYQQADGKLMDVNPAALRILGLTRSEFMGRTSLHPDWQVTDENGQPLGGEEHPSMVTLRTGKRVSSKVVGIFNPKLRKKVWVMVNTHPQFKKGQEKPFQVFVTLHDLTRIKRVEEELRKRNKFIETVMDHIPIGLAVNRIDNGKASYMNARFEKIYGWPRRQITDIEEFFRRVYPDPSYREEIVRKVMNDIHSRDPQRMSWEEVKITRQDGDQRFVDAKNIPLYEQNMMISTVEDVTERKAAREALRESQMKYRDLVEKSGVAIVVDDTEGRITYFNSDFARLFGYDETEMGSVSRSKLFEPAELARIDKYHLARRAGSGAPTRYELRGRKKEGSIFWMEVRTSELRETGQFRGTRNYIWDISQRKAAAISLADSEFRFRELFSAINSGVIILRENQAMQIRDVNPAAETIFEIRKEEVLGKPVQQIKLLSELDQGGKLKKTSPARSEMVLLEGFREPGLQYYIEVRLFRLPNRELVLVIDDVTDRRTAEQQLNKSFNEIRKLSAHIEQIREEERKQIATNLHDELGQILTAIKMDVTWFRKQEYGGGDTIRSRSDNTLKIIDRAIEGVQKITSELRPPMLDNLGLYETIRSLMTEIQSRSGIRARIDLPDEEPLFSPDLKISIYRIVQEGTTNVLRHAEASEMILKIKEKIDILEIKLSDNGRGISEQNIRSSDSLGILGMNERVQSLGGTFKIEGSKGRGTLIEISLPLSD